MAMKFFLKKGNTTIQLPVNPEIQGYDSPFDFEDIEVENLGEVTIFKNRGLKPFSISSFFPHFYNPAYCEYPNFPKPQEIINIIENWRDQKEPIRYIVTGGSVAINVLVNIRNFSIEERFGSIKDVYYSLELKEHRQAGVTRPSSTSVSSSNLPTTYTVKQNDSLSTISKSFYGTTDQWQKIYNANKSTIGANYNVIEKGMKLVIPK